MKQRLYEAGWSCDVCTELGVEYHGYDLQTGFDALTSELPPSELCLEDKEKVME